MGKRYDTEYKVNAVKLANEIGVNNAVREMGVTPSTISTWRKASKEGKLDLGDGNYSPNKS